MIQTRARSPGRVAALVVLAASLLISCYSPVGPVEIVERAEPSTPQERPVRSASESRNIDPIPRYGGAVLVEQGIPHDEPAADRWARHIGTLVAYETYLRRFPQGANAERIRLLIQKRFVPQEEANQEEWLGSSKLEIIEGATCDPSEGLILYGESGDHLPPFFYDDVIVTLRVILGRGRVGVTMVNVFPARSTERGDGNQSYETSVQFNSTKLESTHLAHVLFEGDRMLKSLVQGFDIFHEEPVRSGVPGFATVLELAAQEPEPPGPSDGASFVYGRVWIELDEVKLTTNEAGNSIVFDDFKMEVRAESRYRPQIQFARHLQEHYDDYANEFVIFAELERAARVVATAKWLIEKYPDTAVRILSDAYDDVRVNVPRVVRARRDAVPGKRFSLTGGVVLSPEITYEVASERLVGATKLQDLRAKVLDSRPNPHARAWPVQLGKTPRVAVLIGPPRG